MKSQRAPLNPDDAGLGELHSWDAVDRALCKKARWLGLRVRLATLALGQRTRVAPRAADGDAKR